MVSYYNPVPMYRQQPPPPQVSPAPPHQTGAPAAPAWYAYHPQQSHHPQQFLGCEEQAWAHHHHHHGVFQPADWPPPHDFAVGGVSQADPEPPLQLPSPPITVSSSELSSPGAAPLPGLSPHNHHHNHHQLNHNHQQQQQQRPLPVRSPYEWMKKPSYQSQPNPGKTRTKDKYRVVYSDHQRLELEKEFHYSRYITIRRKAELAANLGLSERQVKIWFQNRRAKERKQVKKREELLHKEKMEAVQQLHAVQQHQQQQQHQHQQQPHQQQQPGHVPDPQQAGPQPVQAPPPPLCHAHGHAHALPPVM